MFETFPRNAHSYAIIRVFASDTHTTYTSTFSHDQLFSTPKLSRSPAQYSRKMRSVIDDGENDAIKVNAVQGLNFTVNISLDEENDTKLQMKLTEQVDNTEFLEQFMTYLKHVEITRCALKNRLHRRRQRLNNLEAAVDGAVQRKQEFDRKLYDGMCHLMKEKRIHWQSGPTPP